MLSEASSSSVIQVTQDELARLLAVFDDDRFPVTVGPSEG
jgi:hypothetical protein